MFDPYPPKLETCTRCPRLAEHRRAIARKERMVRRVYKDAAYWGKPVPGFGDTNASVFLLGLAPGAHGSNRTGRMFTGDASGAFLFPALHRAGFANKPVSSGPGDGLELRDLWISAACRCAPPGNKPTRGEVANCQTWLEHDLTSLPNLRLVLALGAIAHDSYLEFLKARGHAVVKSRTRFEHGKLHTFDNALPMLDSYHVSFQNTNTGTLTPEMFGAVLDKARRVVEV